MSLDLAHHVFDMGTSLNRVLALQQRPTVPPDDADLVSAIAADLARAAEPVLHDLGQVSDDILCQIVRWANLHDCVRERVEAAVALGRTDYPLNLRQTAVNIITAVRAQVRPR